MERDMTYDDRLLGEYAFRFELPRDAWLDMEIDAMSVARHDKKDESNEHGSWEIQS